MSKTPHGTLVQMLACLLPTLACTLPSWAQAQHMVPVDPAGQSRSFRFVLSDTELPWDQYSLDLTPPLFTERYAPMLNHPWHLLANGYFGSADLKFAFMNLSAAIVPGSILDQLRIGYAGATPQHTLFGGEGYPGVSVAWTEPLTMQNPGIEVRFMTGSSYPQSMPEAGWFETEGDGFLIDEVVLIPHSNVFDPSSPPALLQPWEDVLGFLLPGGDVVEAEIARLPLPDSPTNSRPISVAVWIPPDQNVDTDLLEVHAQCGARVPRAGGAFADTTRSSSFPPDSSGNSGPAGAFLRLPPCGGNWFVAVRNNSTEPLNFRMTARPRARHYGDPARNLNVGIAYDASETQIQDIVSALRHSINEFFGATEGAVTVSHIRVFNNAVHCDDSWPADRFACGGEDCRICFAGTTGTDAFTRTWTDGFISIEDPDGAMGPLVADDTFSIAHEMGHSFLQLGDEYVSVRACGDLGGCAYSTMSVEYNNIHGLCTTINHRHGLQDFRSPRTATGNPRVTSGPNAYDCEGNVQFTTTEPAWSWASHVLRIPYPHTAQTPSNHTYDFLFGRADAMGLIVAIVGP